MQSAIPSENILNSSRILLYVPTSENSQKKRKAMQFFSLYVSRIAMHFFLQNNIILYSTTLSSAILLF